MRSATNRSSLLLVVAETAAQRRRLCRAAIERCARQQDSLQVLDLVGDLAPVDPQLHLQRFAMEAWSEALWHDLVPVLTPWFALLELEDLGPQRPFLGAIPGLEAVLQALFLARCWQDRRPDHTLLVVLPPLAQAGTILQLLRRGPELLEGLWTPLLRWWAQTRQRLAQLEVVLRLRLPSADSLELSPAWRVCLQDLADHLRQANAPVEVLMALAVEEDDLPALGARVATLPLCGLPQLRLWLEAQLPLDTVEALQLAWQLPLCVAQLNEALPAFSSWLEQPLISTPQQWISDASGQRCRLFMPGLGRDGLQVRHGEGQLLIQSGSHQLQVTMPSQWTQLACRSARIDSPWLEIGFS